MDKQINQIMNCQVDRDCDIYVEHVCQTMDDGQTNGQPTDQWMMDRPFDIFDLGKKIQDTCFHTKSV